MTPNLMTMTMPSMDPVDMEDEIAVYSGCKYLVVAVWFHLWGGWHREHGRDLSLMLLTGSYGLVGVK